MTHLSARGLSLRYGDRLAYAGVDLDVPRGEITAVVGPSGCGKSSFLATLNRLTDLVPGAVASGALHLDGADVLAPGLDVVAHRRRVGMIFQRPNPFPFSIRWNLELPLREHGLPDRPARIERALRDVGLWDEVKDRLDRPALALSGGQQQRLCLARALALEPEVVLLDEPCSALDPHAAGVVEDHVASLRGRYTVVIVTHDLGQARRLSDATAVFGQVDGVGRLLERGPSAQVFGAPSDPAVARWLAGRR